MMANILQMFFYMFLCVLMFGEAIFAKLNMPCPDFVKNMQENKIMYSIGSFLLFANISGNLRSTGAFEVTINEELAYSKLDTGKMIDAHAMHSIF